MEELCFYERQRLSPWFIIISLLLLIGATIVSLQGNVIALLIILVIVVTTILLYFIFKMHTFIDENGLTIKMFPVIWKREHFAWDEIAGAYVRQYKPIMEYGGWGYRTNIIKVKGVKFSLSRTPFHKEVAYNMQGNIGLQLILKDGRKVLIGTQKPEEIEELLDKLSLKGIVKKYVKD
ncbi:MAG: hypothetical protein LBR51_01930 [Bacteroidales bacterium]|jgi:hypothetical protein|nr:hypothetical protein [Bacteroidales bacterium]